MKLPCHYADVSLLSIYTLLGFGWRASGDISVPCGRSAAESGQWGLADFWSVVHRLVEAAPCWWQLVRQSFERSGALWL